MTQLEIGLIGYSIVVSLFIIFEYQYKNRLIKSLKDWRNYATALTHRFDDMDMEFIERQQLLNGINQDDY